MSKDIDRIPRFAYTDNQLQTLATQVLSEAKQQGASQAEVEISEGFGHSVSVRLGDLETLEYSRDKSFGVTVYLGHARGTASSADFSGQAVAETVKAAVNIARYTAEDSFSGLADPAQLAREFPDLDLYHPWAVSAEDSIALAQACEAAARAVDVRICNSDGASVSTQQAQFVYANSLDFMAGYPSSRHSLSCAVIAEDDAGMQRDYWYSTVRDWRDLESAESIGRVCGERTVGRLGARQIHTCEVPVLFEAPAACSLMGHFVSAVSGGNLYRESSFLLNTLGKSVFAPWVQMVDDPFLIKGLSSGPFDSEGVATQRRDIVQNGVLQGYFLSSYSARKLGMVTTGNAGGNHNLTLQTTGESFSELVKKMDRGLLVTELMGQGINLVNGDYSRGAAGFWVEGGVIQYPVEEITIAGNLADMFQGFVAAGNDWQKRGSKICGSILIDKMKIAGT